MPYTVHQVIDIFIVNPVKTTIKTVDFPDTVIFTPFAVHKICTNKANTFSGVKCMILDVNNNFKKHVTIILIYFWMGKWTTEIDFTCSFVSVVLRSRAFQNENLVHTG